MCSLSTWRPAGRLRTAARVAVVRRRSSGCPVTRLFHECGSATSSPGCSVSFSGASPADNGRKSVESPCKICRCFGSVCRDCVTSTRFVAVRWLRVAHLGLAVLLAAGVASGRRGGNGRLVPLRHSREGHDDLRRLQLVHICIAFVKEQTNLNVRQQLQFSLRM